MPHNPELLVFSPASSIVLASASTIRAKLLAAAGVPHRVEPAQIDEDEIKASLRLERAPAASVAEILAEAKALQVSQRHRDAMVIGADQVLACAGRLYDKPSDIASARAQLQSLRGQAHRLYAGVCVVHDGQPIWHHNDHADLTMRSFSDAFLDDYLRNIDDDVCQTIGGYRLEGPGAQLFSHIDGDHFTIFGLPLLPLLDFLRGHGVIPT